MQRLSLLIAILLTSIALAGCLSGDDDVESDDPTPVANDDNTTPQNDTTTGDDPVQPNTAPTAGLSADLTTGEAPLLVTFNLTGEDADGDTLTWTVEPGDGGPSARGTQLPADVEVNYTTVGNYTAILTVTDGTDSTTTNVTITVTEAAPPAPSNLPENITISDTITGIYAGVGYVAVEDRAHNWSFNSAGVTNMTISVSFDDPTTIDLDWTIFSPSGTEVVSRATYNLPGDTGVFSTEEDPYSVTDAALLKQTGDWVIEIYPGESVEGGYTVHISFA